MILTPRSLCGVVLALYKMSDCYLRSATGVMCCVAAAKSFQLKFYFLGIVEPILGGGVGGGNFDTGVRASILKPTPFIYLAIE